jgi:hypothetical protein
MLPNENRTKSRKLVAKPLAHWIYCEEVLTLRAVLERIDTLAHEGCQQKKRRPCDLLLCYAYLRSRP